MFFNKVEDRLHAFDFSPRLHWMEAISVKVLNNLEVTTESCRKLWIPNSMKW